MHLPGLLIDIELSKIEINKFKCSNYYSECIKEKGYMNDECYIFKCKKFAPRIFEKGKIFELLLHVISTIRLKYINNEPYFKHTSVINAFIDNKFMEKFTIENDFQIWTINRILVILNFLIKYIFLCFNV